MEFRYKHGDIQRTVRVIPNGDAYDIAIDDRHYRVSAKEVNATTLDLLVDGHYLRATHAETPTERWVNIGGDSFHAERQTHRRQRRTKGSGDASLAATMPGQVTAVLVQAGDEVTARQPLVIMEAMKMELRVVAPADGKVGKVFVVQGDTVERGQVLVELA